MSYITLESRFDESKGWDDEDNVCTSISVGSPDETIAGLRNGDEIVLRHKHITVNYTYPLSKPVDLEFEADSPDGFTRADLFRKICQGYRQIYNEEHAVVGDPGNIPGMLNRAVSHGPYGVWGHDIGDLALHTVYPDSSGQYCRLGVDS